MKTLLMMVVALGVFAIAAYANASCTCACVNGEVRAICTSTTDVAPVCSPRVCPVQSPSVEPVRVPSIPPAGASRCVQKQVYNEVRQRYEWKEVCY